jgi:Galactose oxidase, central domain
VIVADENKEVGLRLMHLLLLLTFFSYTPVMAEQTAGTFKPTGDMTTPRIGHTATLLLNGKVLITGGKNPTYPAEPGRELGSAELFDPDTGTFTRTGDMTMPRVFHTATLLPDGRVLIAGGDGYEPVIPRPAEIYDPSTGTFTATGRMVGQLTFGNSTLLDNGKVLIVDAVTDFVSSGPELYDPASGTFSAAGTSAERAVRYGACGTPIVLASGRVLIAPGCRPPAELYDPATDTLSLTGWRVTIGYYDTTETLLPDGRVLIAGGEGDFGTSVNGELYDPFTEQFTLAGNMGSARAAHTASLLRNGTVLIAGGSTFSAVAASTLGKTAEIYNPATGTFSSTSDLTSSRSYGHTATLLIDGRVLIAGGYTDYPAGLTASAELFVPSVLIPASVVTNLRFDRTSVAAGSSYSVGVSGSHLTPQMFFDVRFTQPGNSESAVVLNWQKGVAASHDVPAGIVPGTWTITGVRGHEIETDHTGSFIPVSATITVSP